MEAGVTVVGMEATVTSLTRRFAGNLRAEMARKNLKVVDLAKALKCSAPTARKRYMGQKTFTLGEVQAICEWLDVQPADLLADSPSTKLSESHGRAA